MCKGRAVFWYRVLPMAEWRYMELEECSVESYHAVIDVPDIGTIKATVVGSGRPGGFWSPPEFDVREDDCEFFWMDGAAEAGEVTPDELNMEITVNGREYYLHEYLVEQAMATGEFEWDDEWEGIF